LAQHKEEEEEKDRISIQPTKKGEITVKIVYPKFLRLFHGRFV